MKKIIWIIIGVLIAGGLICFFVFRKNEQDLPKELCDQSWTRTTDVDSETISFGCDKTFSYFYGVGDPVEDSDLCETYSYDGEKIKLNCDGSGYDNVIKILSYDNNKLEIMKNGELRIFEKTDE